MLRRHRALAISSILLGWLLVQPGPARAAVAPSDPVPRSGLSSPHDDANTGKPQARAPEDPVREVRGRQPDDDVSQLVVQLLREAPPAIRREDGGHRIVLGAPGEGGWQVVEDGAGKDHSPAPGDRRHEAAEDTTLELAGTLDPVTVSRIPSGRFGLVADGQPSPSSGLVAALDAALEAPLLAPAPQLTFLRLELHGAPTRWDPAPPSKPPAFTVDTSLTQKGSFAFADGVWNRVGFQSSRVDPQNGGRITVFGDLVHPAQQSPVLPRLGHIGRDFTTGSQRRLQADRPVAGGPGMGVWTPVPIARSTLREVRQLGPEERRGGHRGVGGLEDRSSAAPWLRVSDLEQPRGESQPGSNDGGTRRRPSGAGASFEHVAPTLVCPGHGGPVAQLPDRGPAASSG